ncbi:1-deoxypentalenic acid 11-beta-hydroxylase-like isoform X1 [Branchiostoma floridae x Branchiostoma belcheri]
MDEPGGRRIRLGPREMTFGSAELQILQPSNQLLGDPGALRRELADRGYLFIRGLHDRQEVLDARLEVLKYVKESGEGKLDASFPWQQGVLDSRCGRGCVPFMEGKNSITHSDAVLKVIEGPRPRAFFRTLLGTEPQTFDYKWLRAMYNEGFSGAHVDWVYMSRGTDQLFTMWTPLGDVTMEMGTLAVCEGSHKLQSFQHFQETYGSLDVEEARLKGTGFFTEDPDEITRRFGGQWKSSDFQAGDALIFTMRTVHMSTVNTTRFARVSCDTRWQPAGLPADPRFTGDLGPVVPRFGVHGKDGTVQESEVTMEELKEKWGFRQLLSLKTI